MRLQIKSYKCGFTRSGRATKPTKKANAELRDNVIGIDSPSPPISLPEAALATTGAITNMSFAPPPAVDMSLHGPGNKYHPKNSRWICKVCGKFYLGAKHVALHLKHFPDHSFSSFPDNKEEAKHLNLESWIKETDANTILNLAGPKLFESFSIWELLVKKVALKQLGTPDILANILADIQALVMDVKNMVDQCLTNVRINNDSFSVIFSPMISSILGQNGGGERFVLPYNQIPVHYHTLLGFPKGLKNSQPPDLLSPDSTNDIFPPEEENSQMSMASDTPERPLVEKVVLEANLGTREDIDEETQDSSRMPKRPRLDSESHSATSPPPQTPDFLNHEDESNLSSTSNICKDMPDQTNLDDISESKADDYTTNKIITRTASQTNTQSTRSIFTESTRTRLPSFSSIICGSPKPSNSSEIKDNSSDPDTSELILNSAHMLNTPNKDVTTKHLCSPNVETSQPAVGGSAPVSPGSSYLTTMKNMAGETSGVNGPPPYHRRSSVDQVLLNVSSKVQNLSMPFSPGKGAQEMSYSPGKGGLAFSSGKRVQTLESVREMLLPVTSTASLGQSSLICTGPVTDHSSSLSQDSAVQLRRYPFESDSLADIIKERTSQNCSRPLGTPTPGSNGFLTTSYNVFSTVSSPITMPLNTTNNLPMFLRTPPRDVSENVNTKDYQLFTCTVPFTKTLTCISDNGTTSCGNKRPQDVNSLSRHSEFECSTHVTFSDLNHPIASVSPLKDTSVVEFECSTKTPVLPVRVTASPNLLNDIESVLRETDEFTFHSAMSSTVDSVTSASVSASLKTPEKELTSIPPTEIMIKKPSSLFDNFSQDDLN